MLERSCLQWESNHVHQREPAEMHQISVTIRPGAGAAAGLRVQSAPPPPLLRSLQGQTQHPELRRRPRETLRGMQYSSSCCLERLCQNVGVKMNPPPPSIVCGRVLLWKRFFFYFIKRANSSSPLRLFPDSPPFNEYKYDPSLFFN